MARPLEYGEPVLLWEEGKARTFLIRLEPGGEFHSHRGVILHDRIVGRPEGTRVLSGTGHPFFALRPRVGERMMKVRRRTQIVYPKDAGWLVLALDLFPGARVIEMGTGSGAFTILLCQLVGREGRGFTPHPPGGVLGKAPFKLGRYGVAGRGEGGGV
ncbi:TPA: hypothetical protein DCL37_01780, partial [Candidatus Acetothermia bacterium]|nr:hypothetical protein [Candidatus Acetothermia bacterium]